jgi:predicted nucleic acid-binding protein
VSRPCLDTNFLFGLLRQVDDGGGTDFVDWRQRVQVELESDPPLISGLVIDELTHRLVLAWLRDGGDSDPLTTFRRSTATVMRRMRRHLSSLWTAIDQLDADLAPTDWSVVQLAEGLMTDPGLRPGDAFHAAYAIGGRCRWIVSSDPGFDLLDRVRRVGPRLAS